MLCPTWLGSWTMTRSGEGRKDRQICVQKAGVRKVVWTPQAMSIQEEEAAAPSFLSALIKQQYQHLNRTRLCPSLATIRNDFANSHESEALETLAWLWHVNNIRSLRTFTHEELPSLIATPSCFLLPASCFLLPSSILPCCVLLLTKMSMDPSAVMSLNDLTYLLTNKFI